MTIPASKFGLQPSESYPHVFGILMDWHLGEHKATVVSDLSGFASFSTPSAYQLLGGPHHESGRAAAMRFVKAANRHHGEAVPTSDLAYPEPGRVRFYFLGFDGVRLIEADAEALEKGTDKCSDLWAESQRVIEELRLVTENADERSEGAP